MFFDILKITHFLKNDENEYESENYKNNKIDDEKNNDNKNQINDDCEISI